MKVNSVCILGGTGFVGHALTCRLADAGVSCRVISRRPHRHRDLQVTQGVELVEGDVFDPDLLQHAFSGMDAVINLVGILNVFGKKQGFRRLHVELVELIVDTCRYAGINRFLHMSALNADEGSGQSEYLRTKGEGENRAHTHHGQSAMAVTSFRPSVIFGPGDGLFNRFASLLDLAPGNFPLACPNARFAPVYVGDVADAFVRALDDKTTWGKHYDLCGPEILSLREIVSYTADLKGKRTRIIGLSDRLSKLQARLLELAPGKPFSVDNYQSLQVDSVCQENGLKTLGIEPRTIDSVVPLYLARAGHRQRFDALRDVY